MTKIYDLSQDLNQDCSFWPFYPPFEVKYIKRKSEHGVNAQYIQTSNHMGTHLDAPSHFVTKGKTIDQIPIEWCYGPGVIVDLSDMLDDVGLFTPKISKNARMCRMAIFCSSTLAGISIHSLVKKRMKRDISSVTQVRISVFVTGC